MGVPVRAGRLELVSKVGSWFVVFVVDGVNTFAGIGQVGNGGLDRLLSGELVEALVGDSSKSLRAVSLVIANEFVEFLNIDVDSATVEAEATISSSFSVVTASHGLYVQRQRPDDDWKYSVIVFERDLSQRWQVDTDSQIGRSLEPTENGVLYTVDGKFAELDLVTDETRWTVGGWANSPRSPDVLLGGAIYAGSDPMKRFSPTGEYFTVASHDRIGGYDISTQR